MKMPDAAREAFDALLVEPLVSTRALKRHFASWATDHRALASQEELAALGVLLDATQALLDSIERKTSPLYVRLIHALAAYLMLEGKTSGTDLALTGRVVNSVAHSTRRFQLKFEL